jgi:AcrR family transcriptional regulator
VAEAGLSKGAFYYHFRSKEELLLTILEEMGGQVDEAVRGVGHAITSDADDNGGARHAAERYVQAVERDPSWMPLLLELIAYGAREPRLREKMTHRGANVACDALAALITKRFTARGVEPPLPADELARAITAFANGLLIERVFDPTIPPRLLGDVVELLLRP